MDSIELASETRTSPSSTDRLRAQAIALRRAGRSRREIKEILGIGSNQTLNEALRGEPPPEWTRRPRAKDDLHARARELREQGLDYDEIAGSLGVAKSSVSLWVRDMPRPERLSYEECRKRAAEGAQRYWAAERPVRQARREAIRAAAAAEIGPLNRTGDPDRRGDRLLVRGREEQGSPETGSRSLYQQRSSPDQVLPQVSGHGRHQPRRTDLSRAHPRNSRCSRSGTVLAEGYPGGSTRVSPYCAEDSQPEDSPRQRG